MRAGRADATKVGKHMEESVVLGAENSPATPRSLCNIDSTVCRHLIIWIKT